MTVLGIGDSEFDLTKADFGVVFRYSGGEEVRHFAGGEGERHFGGGEGERHGECVQELLRQGLCGLIL